MKTGIWILGDQLWLDQAALARYAAQRSHIPVILIESLQYVQTRPYHRQKLVLVWSAMRHFAEELRQIGWPVTYEIASDFRSPLMEWIQTHQISELRVMTPSDRPFAQLIQSLDLPCKLTLLPNNHFLWQETEFIDWASSRRRLLMEDFYREGRRRFQILLEGSQPLGGRWNLDSENRLPPRGHLAPPEPLWFEPDAITQAVIQQVKDLDTPLFGAVEPFHWGVTRAQALQVLRHFIATRLPTFGPYQDAMITGQETMWHALISPYLNLGLLQPLEVIQAAEQAFHSQQLPLNSVEGFIRQVLGWREYMHGVYILMGADYAERNWFHHTHSLPQFFWDGKTELNCLHQAIAQVQRSGYAHHIQRLMILSNFALIAGLNPQELENWFHAAFIDAYDWVMQPNVIGMGQFADGGVVASKPYVSSANYINRMSDYCKTCRYDPKVRVGEKACPFNFFYWDFLARHQLKLQSQGRMSFILKNLEKMSLQERAQIQQQAIEWHTRQAGSSPTIK